MRSFNAALGTCNQGLLYKALRSGCFAYVEVCLPTAQSILNAGRPYIYDSTHTHAPPAVEGAPQAKADPSMCMRSFNSALGEYTHRPPSCGAAFRVLYIYGSMSPNCDKHLKCRETAAQSPVPRARWCPSGPDQRSSRHTACKCSRCRRGARQTSPSAK